MRLAYFAPIAALIAGGCANQPMAELPISASEMPASFVYGGLGPGNAHYRQGTNPRNGADIRQMLMSSKQEVAQFAVITLNSDLVFSSTAFRRRLTPLLPADQTIDWGDESQTSGMHPTKYVTFALPAKRLQCVGLERSTKDHPEAPSTGFSQGLAIGYYCRAGQPFSPEEAANVVAAFHTQG